MNTMACTESSEANTLSSWPFGLCHRPWMTSRPIESLSSSLSSLSSSSSSSSLLSTSSSSSPSSELLCVHWHSFGTTLCDWLSSSRLSMRFVDVKLVCDDGRGVARHAHKLVLASASNLFRTMLKDNDEQTTVIVLTDVSTVMLDALLTFIYEGVVALPVALIDDFVKMATALEIKGIAMDSKMDVVENLKKGQKHPSGDLSLLAAAATSGSLWSASKRKRVEPRRRTVLEEALDKFGDQWVNKKKEDINDCSMTAINLSIRDANMLNDGANQNVGNNMLMEESSMEATRSYLFKELHDLNGNMYHRALPLDMSRKSPDSGAELSSGGVSPSKTTQSSPTPSLMCVTPSDEGVCTENTEDIIDYKMEKSSKEGMKRAKSKLRTSTSDNETIGSIVVSERNQGGQGWKSRQPRLCQYCHRVFSNKFNLKQHILNMHTVGRELQCEICHKRVKNKWYLRRHHVTHHGAPLKK